MRGSAWWARRVARNCTTVEHRRDAFRLASRVCAEDVRTEIMSCNAAEQLTLQAIANLRPKQPAQRWVGSLPRGFPQRIDIFDTRGQVRTANARQMTATDQYLNFRPVRSEHHSCTPVRAVARFDRSGQAPPQLLRRHQPHLLPDDDQ